MHEPKIVHWNGAIRVLAYIKGTLGKDLVHHKHKHLCIEAYLDFNYASDKEDRKVLMTIILMLKVILSHGRARSRMWFPDLVLKLNTNP